MDNGLIAVAVLMCVAIVGCAIAQGMVASKSVEAMARQPELYGKLRTAMILALGLIEALAIYGLLIAFVMLSKI